MGRRLWSALALIVLLAACGDAGGTATTTTTTASHPGFPLTIGEFVLDAPPQRILSGSPTHTEILFAVGAGDQVVAVDAFSDFPAEAQDLPKVDAFNPNVEGMAAFDPELVILTYDPGDVVAGLAALGIPALVLDAPVDLDQVYLQIEQVAGITGHADTGKAVTAQMRADIQEIVSGLPQVLRAWTYYHELGPDLYSIGSDTFLGSIYGMLSMVSIADEAGGGYPQLSAEYIIEADPDFVFLGDADCCGQTPETVGERPGWDQLTAVQSGRVIAVDESLASRWGPRVVDLLRFLADAVYGEAG